MNKILLKTKRLVLRDLVADDAKSIAENANDRDIWYFTAEIPYPYKLKDAKWFINKCQKDAKQKPRKNYELGITLKSEKRVIGIIGLIKVNREHKKVVIGYWLGKKYWRRGIMTESEKAVLNFAFNKLKINKISGEALIENKASNILFKKFGFRRVGILKEELVKNGKKVDMYRYELLKKQHRFKKYEKNTERD